MDDWMLCFAQGFLFWPFLQGSREYWGKASCTLGFAAHILTLAWWLGWWIFPWHTHGCILKGNINAMVFSIDWNSEKSWILLGLWESENGHLLQTGPSVCCHASLLFPQTLHEKECWRRVVLINSWCWASCGKARWEREGAGWSDGKRAHPASATADVGVLVAVSLVIVLSGPGTEQVIFPNITQVGPFAWPSLMSAKHSWD